MYRVIAGTFLVFGN